VAAALIARETWRVITARPGAAPLAALAAALRAEEIEVTAEQLAAAPAQLGELLRNEATSGPVLLVVDQLEELFTLGARDAERDNFAEALAGAARAASEPVRVVLTLRDDFLARTQAIPALADSLAPGLVLLGVPAAPDLVRTLTGPARRAGYDFDDPELPARMVEEVSARAGALPLLSFTASRMWELRDRHYRRLTRRAYDAIGGVGGALAGHAETTLAELPSVEQQLVQQAFRHLVTGEGTRAVLVRAELRELLQAGAAGDRVIEKLVAARLLVVDTGADGTDRVEIVHEALLDAWPRLREWRRDQADDARMRDQLRAAARQWDERGRPGGLLWRAEALDELRVWRARTGAPLTGVEEAFVAASLGDARRRRRLGVVGISMVFAALVAVVLVQRAKNRELDEQRWIAQQKTVEARERLIDSYEEQGRLAWLAGDASRALGYLTSARDAGGKDADLRFLYASATRAVAAEDRKVIDVGSTARQVRFTDDGRSVVVGTEKGLLVLDADTGQRRLTLDTSTEAYLYVTNLPGGRTLAGRVDGRIGLYDLTDGHELRVFTHGARITAAIADPGATRVASTGADGIVHIWELETGEPVVALAGPGPLSALGFSADGSAIVAGSTGGVAQIWEVPSGRVLGEIRLKNGASLRAVMFTSGADRILTSADQSIQLWSQRGELLETGSHTGFILHTELDGARTRVATSSNDGTVRIWRARDLELLQVLGGHRGGATDVRFSPSGEEVVSGARDGAVQLWDASSARVRASAAAQTSVIWSVDWSRDGTRLASGASDHTVALWHRDGRARAEVRGNLGEIMSIAFSPDGQELATLGEDQVVRFFEPRTGALRRAWPGPLTTPVGSVVYDRQGHVILSRFDGKITIHEAQHGAVLTTIQAHDGFVNVVAPSPDGTMLVSAGLDRTSALWDLPQGTLRWRHTHADIPIVVFSPDSRRLATLDPNAEVWDVASGNRLYALKDQDLTGIEWSHDGRLLITAGYDRNIRTWTVDGGEPVATLAPQAGNPNYAFFTPDDRLVFSAGADGVMVQSAHGNMLASYTMPITQPVFAAMSPDGSLAAMTNHQMLYVYDLVANLNGM
jgi:WD40 repeat protein